MTAEFGVRAARGLLGASEDIWAFVLEAVRRFPSRTRDRRFWQIQAMVVAATGPHYLIEAAGFTNPFETFHGLAITLYVVPLLYAAINFGWEGALLTGFECALLTSPSMWIWHRDEYHWFAELGQLLITLPVGLLVAWRVDKEAAERRRAETTSARLALLNEVGESLTQTLEVEEQVPRVLRLLLRGLSLEAAWLWFEPGSEDASPTMLTELADPLQPVPRAHAQVLHSRAASTPEGTLVEDQSIVIVLAGESGVLGSMGATVPRGETFSAEQSDLLTTIANQLRVAVENGRLYRERQENLQSYVQQVTQAQEEERRRVARELHDETAQELVHLVRKLEQLGASAGQPLAPPIEELLDTARTTLRSVRRFSRALRPPVLDDLGLLAAIEMVVEDVSSRLPDGARLGVLGEPRRVDSTVELALFRIAQEALRNVEKHSNARSATVKLQFDDHRVLLSISDNGDGFSPPRNLSHLARHGSLGLLGMNERCALVGGSFELRSSPGAGSEVIVTVRSGE